MGETTKETGRQGSTGFRITMKILGTIRRWLYRGSGGKWGQTFFGSPILLLSTTPGAGRNGLGPGHSLICPKVSASSSSLPTGAIRPTQPGI